MWSSAYRVLVMIFDKVLNITKMAVPTKKNDTAMMTRVDWDSFDRPQVAAVARATSAAFRLASKRFQSEGTSEGNG